jgi:hypothetical protein
MSSRFATFTLLGLVVAGGAVTVAGSWYTVKVLDERILASVENINRSGVMRASWYPESALPFSRDGVLHLVMVNQRMKENAQNGSIDIEDPESLRAAQDQINEQIAEGDQKPAEFFINVSNNILPLTVKGSASLDMSRGVPAELVKQKALPAELPIVLAWKYTAYNQRVDLDLSMDHWMLEQPDQTIKVGAAEMTLAGNVTSDLEMHYGWDGIKVSGKHPSLPMMEVLPLEGSSLLRRFAGTWISPEGHMTLTGMTFSGNGSKGEMGTLKFDSVVEDEASETGVTLAMTHHISLAKLNVTSPQDSFNLEDVSLGFKLAGLNKQGIEELAQQAEAKQPDMMQMMKSLNRITTKSIRLELQPSRVMLNKAAITASGKLQTLPFEVDQLIRASAADTADPFKYMVQGDLTVSAESNAVQGLPADVQQQLAALQQDGFVRSDSKGLISELLLRGGVVTANGKLVPLPDFYPQNN